MLKKTTSVVLLLLFAYNVFGFYLAFKINLLEAKEESVKRIARHLPDSELSIICVDKNELENGSSLIIWEDEGKEFKYNDELYDVVRVKEDNNKIYFICLNDVKEEIILNNLCQYIHSGTDSTNKQINILNKMPGYYFQNFENTLVFINSQAIPGVSYLSYENISKEIQTPPPRSACYYF